MKKNEICLNDPYTLLDQEDECMERQITMKIPEEIYLDLRKLSNLKGKPMGKIIKGALDDYIRKCRLKGIL